LIPISSGGFANIIQSIHLIFLPINSEDIVEVNILSSFAQRIILSAEIVIRIVFIELVVIGAVDFTFGRKRALKLCRKMRMQVMKQRIKNGISGANPLSGTGFGIA